MAQSGKKSTKLNILSDIYHEQEAGPARNFRERQTLTQKVRAHFNDPKTVEKWLSGAVLFFGIAGIIFGFGHFKSLIFEPYDRPPVTSDVSFADNINSADQDLLGLRDKDTDQDGLSDYDELYVYQTSPYLEDTDSDGIDDKKEIAQASDPRCPKGQDCVAFYPEAPLAEGSATTTSPVADASQLRQLLLNAGVPAATLEGVSDDQLLQTYLEVTGSSAADQSASSGTSGYSSTTSQTSITLPVDQLSQLTPQQLRDQLLQQGIPAETLNQITDEQLMQLAEDTLQGR